MFLITPITLPVNGDCWLAPLYPVHDFWYGFRVDKLQPTLRWTAFPREIDREKLDPAVLGKVENVTYDLRIWDVTADARNRTLIGRWRNRIVYERTGLASPEHTLEIPLALASQYFWSMRARFMVDGQPMATRWARRGSKCFSRISDNMYSMYAGYYEFETPK